MSRSLWLIGAGNMGGAMLRGWIANGVDPATIMVIDPFAKDIPAGVAVCSEIPAGDGPDVLVLATKPQQLKEVVAEFTQKAKAPRVLLSILAGVETASLKAAFGATHVVRAMPNLPVSIGKGITVLFADGAPDSVREEARALVAPLGIVDWIAQEGLFDAVTALSGSGPGFVFRFIDSLAEAAQALGMPADQAQRLAAAMVEGSAALAIQSPETPGVLADRVASPGGTTREGLNVLDQDNALQDLIARTLAAAARRNAELAAAARG